MTSAASDSGCRSSRRWLQCPPGRAAAWAGHRHSDNGRLRLSSQQRLAGAASGLGAATAALTDNQPGRGTILAADTSLNW